jgi:cell division septation protein DedD
LRRLRPRRRLNHPSRRQPIFLQPIAAKRAEAEVIAELLKKQGFSSMLAPSPDGILTRVLVGPLANPDVIAKTREALVKAGFLKPILRKY